MLQQILLAELDPDVIAVSRQYLAAIHGGAFSDARLQVEIGDGAEYLRTTETPFDLIILDLTDPIGPSQSLYTADFYRLCHSKLGDGGILALHTESPVTRPDAWSRIIATLKACFPVVTPYLVYVPLYDTWWGMPTASNDVDPLSLSESKVRQRVDSRGLTNLQFYNPAMHRAVMVLLTFVVNLLESDAPILTARAPLDPAGIDINRRSSP